MGALHRPRNRRDILRSRMVSGPERRRPNVRQARPGCPPRPRAPGLLRRSAIVTAAQRRSLAERGGVEDGVGAPADVETVSGDRLLSFPPRLCT
jgi:hypothetical protein